MANENWSEISLDNLDDLLKEVENFGSNVNVNAGANSKSSGKENKKNAGSNLQTVLETEEDDEDELEEETEEDISGSNSTVLEDDDDDGEVEDSGSDGNRSDDAERTNTIEELRREAQENQRALAEARAALQHARQEAEKSSKEKSTLLKGNLEAQRDRFDVTSKTLKAQIIKAREESDYVAEEDLREKLQEVNLRKMAVEASLEELAASVTEPVKEVETQKERPLNVQPGIPKATEDFIKRNAWISSASDSERLVLANMSQLLIDQGGDPATEGFYDDLTEALKSIKGFKDKVASKPDKASAPKKGSPVAPKEQATEASKRTKIYRTEDGKTKVKVTKADVDMAKRLGFDDPKQYIREKVKWEKQTGGTTGQWASIDI